MSKWELTVVENAGEIPASKVTDEIATLVEPMISSSRVLYNMSLNNFNFTFLIFLSLLDYHFDSAHCDSSK